MIAIDTNVVVRFLTNDDLAQANRAEAVLRTENTFLPKTVLLETAWVLQAAYGLPGQMSCWLCASFLGWPASLSRTLRSSNERSTGTNEASISPTHFMSHRAALRSDSSPSTVRSPGGASP